MDTKAAEGYLINWHRHQDTARFADRSVIRRLTLPVVLAAYQNLEARGLMEPVGFVTIDDHGGIGARTYKLTPSGQTAVGIRPALA